MRLRWMKDETEEIGWPKVLTGFVVFVVVFVVVVVVVVTAAVAAVVIVVRW